MRFNTPITPYLIVLIALSISNTSAAPIPIVGGELAGKWLQTTGDFIASKVGSGSGSSVAKWLTTSGEKLAPEAAAAKLAKAKNAVQDVMLNGPAAKPANVAITNSIKANTAHPLNAVATQGDYATSAISDVAKAGAAGKEADPMAYQWYDYVSNNPAHPLNPTVHALEDVAGGVPSAANLKTIQELAQGDSKLKAAAGSALDRHAEASAKATGGPVIKATYL